MNEKKNNKWTINKKKKKKYYLIYSFQKEFPFLYREIGHIYGINLFLNK